MKQKQIRTQQQIKEIESNVRLSNPREFSRFVSGQWVSHNLAFYQMIYLKLKKNIE